MVIAVPKERENWENRVALTPEGVKKLVGTKSARVLIEESAGAASGFSDREYSAAGAEITAERKALLKEADILLRLGKPPAAEIPDAEKRRFSHQFSGPLQRTGSGSENRETKNQRLQHGDDSPQYQGPEDGRPELPGKPCGLRGGNRGGREIKMAFPMMMTPAGTISPVRVFRNRRRGSRASGHCHGKASGGPGRGL